MEHLTDDELIEIYLKKELNSQIAFEILLVRYKKSIYSFLLRMVSHKPVAEDLFQEVFMKVIKGLPEYKAKNQFKSWIFQIANNLAIDYLRRKNKIRFSSIEDEIMEVKENKFQLQDILSSCAPLPEKIIENKEFMKELSESLKNLTIEQREVFILRHESGLSFKEIAKLLKCPLNTALGRMNQAIKKLKKYLYKL
jgi:RNA polymerase sigma-70 factor (ECF subfamily)